MVGSEVFVDSNFWIAAARERDAQHERAKALGTEMLTEAWGLCRHQRVDVQLLGNVLQFRPSQRHHRAYVQFLGHIPIDHVREANGVGLGQFLQALGDVHPVAEDIPLFLHDVPEMDADADMNLFDRFVLGIVGTQLRLNILGTLHGVHDGRKVYEKGIPDRLDDRAVMLSDRFADKLVMRVQQPQRAGLVAPHLAAKADDVRKHDRRQSPSL